ncbi:MAG TPA: hypothetical protein VJN72_06295 [Gaiellales bacterium]|nr:hypothetical protein [Gaiellales bacterium]
MAARKAEFTARISAEDDASKVLDKVADKADDLESDDVEVEVSADVDDRDIDQFERKLDGLTDADKIVVLSLRAGNVQNELTALATDLATIDQNDPNIDIKLQEFGELSGQLDEIQSKMQDIADTSLDPDVGNKAKEKLDGIVESSGKAGDAVHSMAGNAIGDFAATTSGVGPLGEAIGQLTEGILGGEVAFGQLATAALGLGAISAAVLVLNKVMDVYKKRAEEAAKIKAFNEEQVKTFTTSIIEARKAVLGLDDSVKAVDDTVTGVNPRMQDFNSRAAELVKTWEKAGKIEAFDPVKNEITDLLPIMAKAKINADDYAKAIIGADGAQGAMAGNARRAGGDIDAINEIVRTAASEYVNYRKANKDAADQTAVFSSETKTTAVSLGGLNDKMRTGAQVQRDAADAAKAHADALNEVLDASVAAADSQLAATEAKFAFGEATKKTNEVLNDHEATLLDAKNAIDDERDAAIDAAKAALRLADDHATAAGGALSAKQRLDALNTSLLESARTATPQARQAIVDYIVEVNNIPPEKATAIQALIDQGKWAEAAAALGALGETVYPVVSPKLDHAAIMALGAGLDNATKDRTVKVTADTSALVAGISAGITAGSKTLVRVNGGG